MTGTHTMYEAALSQSEEEHKCLHDTQEKNIVEVLVENLI